MIFFDERSIDFIEFAKELDDLNKLNILGTPPVGAPPKLYDEAFENINF